VALTCTDRGQHPAAELARLWWMPDDGDTVHVWSPGDETLDVDLLTERTRATRSGGTRHRVSNAAWWVERSDGGRTLHMLCPRCGRNPQIRDDRLIPLRLWPNATLDVSQAGW